MCVGIVTTLPHLLESFPVFRSPFGSLCRLPGRRATVLVSVLGSVLLASGCSGSSSPKEEASAEPPTVGACRVVRPGDIASPSNSSSTVDCGVEHTAETFHVGEFGDDLANAAYDDPRLGAEVYRTCAVKYMKFTGADESLALRTVLSWAWWRPTEDAWKAGARWYRCDVTGGTEDSPDLVTLPQTAKGVLLGKPDDEWMACVVGDTVSGVPHVPCNQPHDWRAVSTIVVGKDKESYPGDRAVEVVSRDYCSRWIGAWLNFTMDFEYGYTWFDKAEWESGNRRSVCWARTDQ